PARRAPGEVFQVRLFLEREPGSELSRESARQSAARGVNESDRLLERWIVHHGAEVVAVVRMVRQIERLERELQPAVFTQLDVLRQASIQIEVRIATE